MFTIRIRIGTRYGEHDFRKHHPEDYQEVQENRFRELISFTIDVATEKDERAVELAVSRSGA